MLKQAIFTVVGLLAISLTCAVSAEEFKAKCPVSGAAAKKESAVDYKGGKVYFCCDGCKRTFEQRAA